MGSAFKYKFASSLYKIEMDSDKYFNPSPSFMSFQLHSPIVKCTSKPHSIKPVFNFTFQHRYPLGLACVLFGSNHHLYFMGGSISYTLYFNKSREEAKKLYDEIVRLDSTDPNMYPPHVYVFDCFTCQLLSPQHSPPPMNSGKSANPFTFVEKNKLYVLSSSTDVPKELDMFEVFYPDSRTWTILTNPPYDWTKLKKPLGSVLIDGVFFVSFAKDYHPDNPVHLFSYNIADDKWNEKLSVSRPLKRGISVVPSFSRDSVFVQNKLYSANARPLFQNSLFKFPVLSYGPIPTTAKLDASAFDEVTPNLTPIFPLDACWPTYDGGIQGWPFVRLVHLGGLLQGTKTDTTCFGFVQVVGQLADEDGCYIRFVAFEAFNDEITRDSDTYKDAANSYFELPDECGPFFKARTLHASHFYSPDKSQFSFVNAVCALVLS